MKALILKIFCQFSEPIFVAIEGNKVNIVAGKTNIKFCGREEVRE